MGLRMESPRGVDNQHVKLSGHGFLAGIVRDAGRVAALLTLDDLAAETLTPDGELLDRRRPERVAGGHHDFLTFFLTAACQLGDTRRFARAVDTGDHHDRR